ncbi:hypothetical protein JL720_7630 [Aureococcus anophagefferens]|nr:hypothetical protein JL720_7630 [Aureococcus anophagefferens]
MEAFAARDRERADLAREADRQRRKEEKRRRERREAAKVAAAANVAAERSDDLLRAATPPERGATRRGGPTPEVLSARNDVERAELWRELGDYANAIRSAKDADGAPTVRFPENYDEVVKLMNRRDLGEGGDAAGRSWAASSLRAGVGRACGSGDLSRYKGVLDDGVQEERMVLGLATIERLDRELRRRQRLDDAHLAGDATDGPGTARSLASSASDAVFLTEKRPRSKRSRFRDRNR